MSTPEEPVTAELERLAFALPLPVAVVEPARPGSTLAVVALGVSMVALAGSLVFGLLLPVAIIAVILAMVALRRGTGAPVVARWALVLGLVSTVFSVGWLLWAAYVAGLFL